MAKSHIENDKVAREWLESKPNVRKNNARVLSYDISYKNVILFWYDLLYGIVSIPDDKNGSSPIDICKTKTELQKYLEIKE